MTVQAQQTRLRLENLIEIIRLMMETDEPDKLLRTILESAVRFFSAEACSIALLDKEGRHLSFAFSVGGADVKEFRIDLGHGIVGWGAH
jgi:signal transduction protein with GAF and PtsI domain